MKKVICALVLVMLISLCVSAAFAAPKPYPVSIKISPDQSSIQVGKYVQLKATVISNLNTKMSVKVEWSCGQGGVVSKTGKFTAGLAAGIVPVTVTIPNTQIFDTVDVNIIPKPYPASITISPDQSTIQVGSYVQLKTTVMSNENKKMSVKVLWSCGQGGVVSNTGKFTAGLAAGIVPVTVTVVGYQVSDTVDVRIIPDVVGTYIGRWESSVISGSISFVVTKTSFKVLFLPEVSGNFSTAFSGKTYSDGTLSGKVKIKAATVELECSVLDGQNLSGSFHVVGYDFNNQPLDFTGTIDAQLNTNPVSGGYTGYWQDYLDPYKGKLVAILDDNGITYNLAESTGEFNDESLYFEGNWNGNNVTATIEDPEGNVDLIALIYPNKTIKGYVNNDPKKPTKISLTKIKF